MTTEHSMLEKALVGAPDKMTLRDETAWKQVLVEYNCSEGGIVIIRFAECWARLMEVRIANGDTIRGCAEETLHIIGTEIDISGSMYDLVVSVLSQVWMHGKKLRRWDEKRFQPSIKERFHAWFESWF